MLIYLSLCYPSQVNVKRIVHGTIYSRVTPYLSDWQHEFLSWGCSCVTQLVLSHHHWIKALDDGSQVDVVFLDFAKAYYRVSHDRILQKLCNFGISETLLNWSKFYLTNREQRVVIDGKSSTWSVIPQGSLLGPLFIVIFISDLLEVVMPVETKLHCMEMTIKHLE